MSKKVGYLSQQVPFLTITYNMCAVCLTNTVHIHFVLSISMTACSSIMALGMMPLCLLIYTSIWTSSNTIQIPYDSIGE